MKPSRSQLLAEIAKLTEERNKLVEVIQNLPALICEHLMKTRPKKPPLGGVEITREQALEGLGDPSTWDEEAKALYAEFEKKPS